MIFVIYFAIFVFSVFCVHAQINSKLLANALDHPNDRSSHAQATKSAGGLSIIVMFSLGLLAVSWIEPGLFVGLIPLYVGAIVIGLMGLVDDYFDLSAAIRLALQVLFGCVMVFYFVTDSSLLGHSLTPVLKSIYVAGVTFCIVWHVNLYNFMDGIDGLAASQTIYVCSVVSIILYLERDFVVLNWLLMLGLVTVAFLIFNWPKASLFMGDTGSGFLGFVLAGLCLYTVLSGTVSIESWLIILSVFVVDSSVTLVRRLLSRKRVFDAHRSHAYQNLSRKYNSHKIATLVYIALNLLFVTPAAFYSYYFPGNSFFAMLFVYLMLVIFCLSLKAGIEGVYEENK